jgi:outer membrane protein assembly factor BamA
MRMRTATLAVVVVLAGGWVHPASGQVTAPSPAESPMPADPLDGRIVREIRVGPATRPATADIVLRHLGSRQGAPFRRATLLEDQRRLDALRLFSSIAIRPLAVGDEVVLLVEVKETLRLLPFVALSITDENGVSAGPAFRGINVLGRGTLSSATLQFGGATAVGGRLQRPSITPGTWTPDISAVYRSRHNELFDFDETSTTVAARAGWNWTSRVQTGGRVEYMRLDTGSSGLALSSDGSDNLPTVAVSATYNSLDSQSNPRVGWLGSVEIGRVFGDARAWTTTLDGRRYQPLTSRSTVSVLAFAALQSGELGRDLPEYMQYSLGGTNSVRGWAFGSRVGKHQAIATVEYACALVPVRPFSVFGFSLYGGIQAAAFGDVGLAWNEHLAASQAIDGYGVGLRLLFPFVDVIRLDLAAGEPGSGPRLSIGIQLKADKQRERVR